MDKSLLARFYGPRCIVYGTVVICVTASTSQSFLGSGNQSSFVLHDFQLVVDTATSFWLLHLTVIVHSLITTALNRT